MLYATFHSNLWQIKYLALLVTLLVIDYFLDGVPFTITEREKRSVIDNLGHGLTGYLSWLMVRSYNGALLTERLVIMESFICLFVSSLIDVDHFIMAKSLSIIDATSLPSRPFLHCSTVLIIVSIAIFVASLYLNVWWMHSLAFICFTGWSCHHLRDGLRRGLWFCPLGSTAPIPYRIYLIIIIVQPAIIANLVDLSAMLAIRRQSFRPLNSQSTGTTTSCLEEEV